MSKIEKFQEEVKNILSGSITDKNVVNYIAIKITRLHEMYPVDKEGENNE